MNHTDILTAYDTLYAIRSEIGREAWDAIIGHIDGLEVTDVTTIAPAKPTEPKATKKAKPAKPSTDGKHLCEVCSERFSSPVLFGQHMRENHWDDVVAEYELNGIVGLQREFGVSVPTSYTWAKKIEKAAA